MPPQYWTNRDFELNTCSVQDMEQPNAHYGRRYVTLRANNADLRSNWKTAQDALGGDPGLTKKNVAAQGNLQNPRQNAGLVRNRPIPPVAGNPNNLLQNVQFGGGLRVFEPLYARMRNFSGTKPSLVERGVIGNSFDSNPNSYIDDALLNLALNKVSYIPNPDGPGPDPAFPPTPKYNDFILPEKLVIVTTPGAYGVPSVSVDEVQETEVGIGLYLVERYRLAVYSRGFGIGDNLYSISLFPEEELTIEVRTYRTEKSVVTQDKKEATSFFDEQNDTTENALAEEFNRESAASNESSETFKTHVDAHVEAGWGWGSANVNGSADYSSADSAKNFAKNVNNTTQKLASRASSSRRVQVDQLAQTTTTTDKTQGEEKTTRRVLRNINKCRTITYNYFQMLRKYETRLELIDVKVYFSDGERKEYKSLDRPQMEQVIKQKIEEGSLPANFKTPDTGLTFYLPARYEEYPLDLANQFIVRTFAPQAARRINQEIYDYLGPNGLKILVEGINDTDYGAGQNQVRLKTLKLKVKSQDNSPYIIPDEYIDPEFGLPLALSNEERVVATAGVYVDAMLGKCSACEDFIEEQRSLDIELKRLEVERLRLELDKMRIVNERLQRDDNKTEILIQNPSERTSLRLNMDLGEGDTQIKFEENQD